MQETHPTNTIAVKWTARELFPSQYHLNCSAINTPYFLVSGSAYYLQIYRKGKKPEDNGWVSVYLKRINKFPTKCLISHTIGIRMSNGFLSKSFELVSEFLESDFCGSVGYGVHRVLETSVLEANFSQTIFFCQVQNCTPPPPEIDSSIGKSALQTVSQQSVLILQQNFRDLFLNGNEGDVTFKVQDREFKAHRFVLSARSTVFFAMFNHNTEEKRTGIVTIKDSDPNIFHSFLLFLYTGDLNIVSSTCAVGLYILSDKYNIIDLKNGCICYMVKGLSVENFCDVVLLATLYEDSELLKSVTDFFAGNIEAIIQTSAWLSLGKEHFDLMNKLFIEMARTRKMLRKPKISEK